MSVFSACDAVVWVPLRLRSRTCTVTVLLTEGCSAG